MKVGQTVLLQSSYLFGSQRYFALNTVTFKPHLSFFLSVKENVRENNEKIRAMFPEAPPSICLAVKNLDAGYPGGNYP